MEITIQWWNSCVLIWILPFLINKKYSERKRRFRRSQKILQTWKLHFWIIHENFPLTPLSFSLSHLSASSHWMGHFFLFFLHNFFFCICEKLRVWEKINEKHSLHTWKTHCPTKKKKKKKMRSRYFISVVILQPSLHITPA